MMGFKVTFSTFPVKSLLKYDVTEHKQDQIFLHLSDGEKQLILRIRTLKCILKSV